MRRALRGLLLLGMLVGLVFPAQAVQNVRCGGSACDCNSSSDCSGGGVCYPGVGCSGGNTGICSPAGGITCAVPALPPASVIIEGELFLVEN